MTSVFVEKPLALPGSAKYYHGGATEDRGSVAEIKFQRHLLYLYFLVSLKYIINDTSFIIEYKGLFTYDVS